MPARSLDPAHARAVVTALVDDGLARRGDRRPGRRATPPRTPPPAGAVDLAGRTDLAELAAVLRGAAAVVVGNTGPAHLAAAVGTPVVSLFAPVVPAERWRPWGVPDVLLGDQDAACRGHAPGSAPCPGHPCLSTVSPRRVAEAVRELVGGAPAGTCRSRKGRREDPVWHVHGSWTTSFVAGAHDYVLPLLPDRGRDGLGRARTWHWPETAERCRPTGSRTNRSTWWCCSAPTRQNWSSA